MSKANYRKRNQTAIKRGFKSLQSYAEGMSDIVMRNIARDGLNKLIEMHEISAQYLDHNLYWHLDESNTMGYALAHDGIIVESGFHEGGGSRGAALSMAQDAVRGKKGWVAVVLSDMQQMHYIFSAEEDALREVVTAIRDEFAAGANSVYVTPGAIPKPE